jgi:hypothetical protein
VHARASWHPIKMRPNIHRTVKHAQDFDPFAFHLIKDEITPEAGGNSRHTHPIRHWAAIPGNSLTSANVRRRSDPSWSAAIALSWAMYSAMSLMSSSAAAVVTTETVTFCVSHAGSQFSRARARDRASTHRRWVMPDFLQSFVLARVGQQRYRDHQEAALRRNRPLSESHWLTQVRPRPDALF